MPESVDPRHLLLIGAGPGVGAGVVRRFGREGFRSTLIARGEAVEQLAAELRSDGLEVEAVRADIEDLDGYRATLEQIFRAPGAPGVAVYNAALPDPGEILDTTVGRLRTAYAVDVLGAVVAAQVAAPVLRTAGTGTLLFTSGGFADHPVPGLASLSMGKAALRSAATLIAAGVREDGIHAATITIAGAVVPGTEFDPDNLSCAAGRLTEDMQASQPALISTSGGRLASFTSRLVLAIAHLSNEAIRVASASTKASSSSSGRARLT